MTALEGKTLLDHGRTIAKRYARRVGPELAEELRAEAVVRALGSPPPDGRLEPWLERIYRNLFVDRWRRRQMQTVDLDDLPHLSGHGTPEDELLRHERRRAVRGGLNRLPREARRALLSRFYGELDDSLAATRLGIAPVTMRTRIHRALARLREGLTDLRAWCPPALGKLGTQAAAVGLAPVMVAALIVTAPSPAVAPPAPQDLAVAVQEPARPQARPRVAAETVVAAAAPRVSERPARRSLPAHAPALPAPATVAITQADPIVGEILQPDAIDVFAEPERPTTTCMVEAPPSFVAQIDKTLEEL